MSINALNWALETKTKTSGQKCVLIVLANFANEENETWPSQRTIARQSCMSLRAVRYNLVELEKANLIIRSHRHKKDGTYDTDSYKLPISIQRQNLPMDESSGKIRHDPAAKSADSTQIEPINISIPPYPQKGDVSNGEEKQDSRNESEGARQESEDKRIKPQSDKRESTGKRRESKSEVEIPDWLKTTDWEDFKAHRKALKKPLSDVAEKRAISTLAKLRDDGEDIADVINTSIVNGWLGLFPVKNKNPARDATSTPGRAQPNYDRGGRTHEQHSRPLGRGERNARQFANQLKALEQAIAEEAQEELDRGAVDQAPCDLRGEVVRFLPKRNSGCS